MIRLRFLCFALLLLVCISWPLPAGAQTLVMLDSGRATSIRGMSIPTNKVIWLSGSKGHVARSTDGGKSWKWMTVSGYEKTDFRDIHAFDSLRAVIMGIDNPAYILKTSDGGNSWQLVYTKSQEGMFLDAMDFRNKREGICIGDPVAVNGERRFFIIRTKDGGDSWQEEPAAQIPLAAPGEAVFSASGTNIAFLNRKDFEYAFISGGMASNLYLMGRKACRYRIFVLSICKGKESDGAFSMATDRRNAFYCIGGDYKSPDSVKANLTWTYDDGKHWSYAPTTPPAGYRSCIRIIEGHRMVACGSNGVDICDSPEAWRRVSSTGFNVCMVSPDRKQVFLAGDKGRVGLMKL